MVPTWPIELDQFPTGAWDRQFDLGLKMRITWLLEAWKLRRAADILFEAFEKATRRHVELTLAEIEETRRSGRLGVSRQATPEEEALMIDEGLIGTYLMLTGLAIENTAKGILISRDPDRIDEKGRLRSSISTHNLLRLVRGCRLALSLDQERILTKVTHYVVWRGRYPIPAGRLQRRPVQLSDGSWIQSGDVYHRSDRELIESLYQQLEALLVAIWRGKAT